jgi:hypothetical protein
MRDRLLSEQRGPTVREALVAASLFAFLGLLAYGSYVAHGGFYSDDWSHAANYHFAASPRYFNSVSQLEEFLGGRPLSALLMPLPQAVFGPHPAPHLALAAFLGVLTSLCFFLFLRTMAMAPLHAWMIGALALLFPWADSSRLWATASVNSLSVCFFLLGLAVALRGFDHRGRRGTLMHAGADLLYLLSVLTYEVTAAVALLAGFLYLGRTSRPRALRSWAADVAVVFAGLLYSLLTTVGSRPVATVGERIEDLSRFFRESLLLLASALQPFGEMGRPVQALVLLAAAAVVALAVLRLRRSGDAVLRRWLGWGLIGLVAAAAAYFMFLGSHLYPRDPGIDNRINVFASLAFCLIVYAVIACACRLFLRARGAAVATAALALLVGVGYAVALEGDRAHWVDAADQQQAVLGEADRMLLPLPRGSTVIGFGSPSQAAPEVPVFNRPWDLQGALQLRSGDAVRRAYPVYAGIEVNCRSRLQIDGGPGYGSFEIPYRRRLYFYEAGGRAEPVRSRAECRRALGTYRPGPLEA